jgi:hypothetical protein
VYRGDVVTGMPSHTGHRVYRCSVPIRDRSWPGAHVARQAQPVEKFIEKLVIGRLSRADAADLVADSEGGPDVVGLREEAAAIRRNLEEMAPTGLGLITRLSGQRAGADSGSRPSWAAKVIWS